MALYRIGKNIWLRRVLFFLLCSITMIGCAQDHSRLHDSEGRIIKMSDLKNKWIIVNYWADWCESCIEEIPELNRFYQNNQDKNIVILGVNYDRLPRPYLNDAIRKTGIVFPVLLEDPSELWRLGEVTVLPTTFIVNPQGDVVKKIIGPNTEQSLLKILQNRVLAKGVTTKKRELG